MSTISYKCPSCGSPLAYDGKTQDLGCDSCGHHFDVETVQQVTALDDLSSESRETQWHDNDRPFTAEEIDQLKGYHCSSCGSELVGDATTVATNCAFCGSPSIMPTQFTDETRPSYVLPFRVDKAQAEGLFHAYFKGKRLMPDIFLKRKNQITDIRQMYVPYWLFDCKAHGRFTYRASTTSISRSGQYRITRTRHYTLYREGTMDFAKLPVDAAEKWDNKVTEALEPFPFTNALSYSPDKLSGALANRADVSADTCKDRADQRIRQSVDARFRQTTVPYSTVVAQNSQIDVNDAEATPVLLPIWHMTTIKDGRSYTFAINGQTGETVSDIPYSKAKFFRWLFLLGGGLSVAGYGIIRILVSMGVLV